MAKQRATSNKKSTKAAVAKPSWTRRALVLFFKLSLVVAVLSAGVLVYLDAQIRLKFEGKRWALPAKVYARPLELYPGALLSRDQLKQELKGLGYRFVRRASEPGTVEWASSRARLYTRGFSFPDGNEASRRILLQFSGNSVTRITDDRGQSVPILRLEPILVGGIYPKDNEDRDLIRLDQAPHYLAEALVAVEDRDFYQHHGVSPRGIARAMVVNLKAGRFVQGGSTLTQQLVKNFYLSSERTLTRKLTEIPMAVLLDLHYDKEEILEAYLNEVYLGQSGSRAVHGFGLASQYYFAQPIGELKLHQVALLAGLVKGPSFYDPRRHPKRAKERRDLVLRVLHEQGAISNAQMIRAMKQPLGVVKQRSLHKGGYPAYLDLVKRQLREEYPEEALSSEGLQVFTSLDPVVQARASAALQTTSTQLEKRFAGKLKKQKLQGAMVVTDPQTGEILALVGGRNSRYQGFNRALDARRPIGSLVKPAVYLAALENGFTLASLIEDAPLRVTLDDGSLWQPRNFDRKSHGEVALHRALANSYNQSTAWLGMTVGVDNVVDTLMRLGLKDKPKPYPSLLLGAESLSPFSVATVYQTIAANGFNIPMRAIRLVTTAEGDELSRYPLQVSQSVDPRSVHLIQYAMQEVVREGTARYVYQRLPADMNVAGKTGTSNGQRDSWFAGFAGNRMAVVWMGLDDNGKLPFTGSGGALRAWTDFMVREQPDPFLATRPDGVEYHWVDETSGYLAGPRCEGARQIPFMIGSEPLEQLPCAQEPDIGETLRQPLNWFKRWFRQE